jgi:hypothetical protein
LALIAVLSPNIRILALATKVALLQARPKPNNKTNTKANDYSLRAKH